MSDFLGIVSVDGWTIVSVLLNLIIVYIIVKKLLYNPVKKIILDRQQEIDSLYNKAETSKQTAYDLEKNYDIKLASVREEGEIIFKDYIKKAEKKSDSIIEEANKKSNEILNKAKKEAESQKKNAINESKSEISSIAILLAEKIVDKEIEKDNHKNTIDKFIESLGEMKWVD